MPRGKTIKRSLFILPVIVASIGWYVWGAVRETNRPAGHHYDLAQQAIAGEDNEEAVSQLRITLAKDPDHNPARWQLANLYIDAGRSWAALPHLDRLGKHEPRSEVEFARARVLVALRRDEEMLALTEALDGSARDVELRVLRAQSLVRLRRIEEAEHIYRQPDLIENATAILGLAEIAFLRRDTAAARRHLAPLLEAGNSNRKAHLLQAETLFSDGSYAASEKAFASVLNAWPDDWGARIGLIRSNIAENHMDQAARNLSEFREIAPFHPEVQFLGGLLAEHDGDIKRATIRFQRVLRLSPEHYEASLRLGEIFYREQKYASSQMHFRSATQSAPHNRAAFIGLARAQRDAGRLRAAAETLRRLIDADPSAAVAYFELAIVLETDGDIAGSRRALLTVLEIEPDHRGAIVKLGE